MREFVVKIDMEEMPKSCDDCDIAIKYQRFGTEIECPFLGWYADRDKCPIICQLPEGHGRLIDWDAFERIGFKLCRKTSEWRVELGTPTNESYVVPAERMQEE